MTITSVLPWTVNDPPSPPAGHLAPLTDTAQAHGWRYCSGCGDGFRCRDCGHYRHDTKPDDGYRCGRCVAYEAGALKLVLFISEALSIGVGTPLADTA
jgi:hypothetical protein